LSFYYLLDARTEGRIVALRFYDAQTGDVKEIKEPNYKPYFYLPHPLSKAEEEGIKNLHGETQIVKKRDLYTNELKDLTKVTVYTLDALKKVPKEFEKTWENEIDYTQSFVYDHDFVFGAAYENNGNQLTMANTLTAPIENKFENAFADTRAADAQKYIQIKHWFKLLQQPTPSIKPELLGTKETDRESLLDAFTLARIANIPVTQAYRSHRVSEWLKSIIYTHCEKATP